MTQPFHFTINRTERLTSIASVPVRLVDIPVQAVVHNSNSVRPQPTNQVVQKPSIVDETNKEGVNFVAEGGQGVIYLGKLKTRIFHLWEYPQDAIKKNEQGKVAITFELNNKGEVVNISVLTSSGSKRLDSAAMAAIEKAGPFGPFTADIKDKTLKVTGQFRYVLD